MRASRSILNAECLQQIKDIKHVDFLVGIPSHGDVDTIAHVVATTAEGINKYFPGLTAAIVNASGDPEDFPHTHEYVMKVKVPENIHKIVTHYRGVPGKGSAFRTIFEIADRLGARIVLTLDADLRSIKPKWIKLLADPIYKYSFGFVTPLYFRHKHDGTITNNIAYPLTRALYGQRVRQPIGGEFCFSGALAKLFSHQKVWDSDIAKFGIDVWMTTTAITEGFRLSQASMGVKLHDPKDPSTDLGPMFHQVVGTLFTTMRDHEVKWKAIEGSAPIYKYGGESRQRELKVKEESPDHLIERFKAGFKTHKAFYKHYLNADGFTELQKIALAERSDFHFPEELWAQTVYDFAVTYNWSGEKQRYTVGALTPIYFGRTASFMLEVEGMSATMVEALIEGQARIFEQYKPYLIKRWDDAKAKAKREGR